MFAEWMQRAYPNLHGPAPIPRVAHTIPVDFLEAIWVIGDARCGCFHHFGSHDAGFSRAGCMWCECRWFEDVA